MRTAQTQEALLLEPVSTVATIAVITIWRTTVLMMMVMLLAISVAERHGKSTVRLGIKWFVKFQF